ncbi:MAG TPA: YihY/virulence factor BrkB family protein [candidate division Zixibacteria bacterium]|nr:YihY/virulence factor BrkB family protein [candidate division Zixibacteria bacterium]
MWQWLRHYFGGLYDRSDSHHLFLNASGLAFSLFVCVVPMVLILFYVLGTVLERKQVERELAAWIDRVIPYEKYTEEPKQFIFSRLDEFRAYRKVAGVVGALGLLFAASGLFSSMRTVLNQIFHTSVSKHVLIGKLRDLGMIVLVIGYFLLSMLTLPILDVLAREASGIGMLKSLNLSTLDQVLVTVLSFAVIYVAFWSLYHFIPYARMERRVVAVSAFWAALLWEVAKQAFSVYLSNAATLPVIYGTYLFIIVAAFWIYYSSIVFILGAEIGQLYRERREAKTGTG